MKAARRSAAPVGASVISAPLIAAPVMVAAMMVIVPKSKRKRHRWIRIVESAVIRIIIVIGIIYRRQTPIHIYRRGRNVRRRGRHISRRGLRHDWRWLGSGFHRTRRRRRPCGRFRQPLTLLQHGG